MTVLAAEHEARSGRCDKPCSRVHALRQARALADELNVLVRDLAQQERAQTALGRLLEGTADSEDFLRLSLPVPGSRLLVMPAARRDGLEELVRSRRLPFAWHELDLVVLVPRRHDIRSLYAQLSRLTPACQAGASSMLQSAAQLPAGYEEARRVRELTAAPLSFADEHWCELATAHLAREVARALPVSSPLHALAGVRPEFRDSLLAWLASDGDTNAAARASTVHPNTLRYRLKRIEQQVGIDLNSPQVRYLARMFLELPRM